MIIQLSTFGSQVHKNHKNKKITSKLVFLLQKGRARKDAWVLAFPLITVPLPQQPCVGPVVDSSRAPRLPNYQGQSHRTALSAVAGPQSSPDPHGQRVCTPNSVCVFPVHKGPDEQFHTQDDCGSVVTSQTHSTASTTTTVPDRWW